ncbi:5-methylcytosine restriction system specificity protein McrC, partial [Pseudomonas viridiflava]
LNHADVYQMVAYGQTYLRQQGDLLLIYPKRGSFQAALQVFEISTNLKLWILPFDLVSQKILCANGVSAYLPQREQS